VLSKDKVKGTLAAEFDGLRPHSGTEHLSIRNDRVVGVEMAQHRSGIA
jgi:hypothetical protein